MKLMHATTTTLNTREFNKLSDKIANSLYELSSEARDLYDIHINYINEEWRIDFLPILDNIPVINVETYIDQRDNGTEILRLTPTLVTDLPGRLKLEDENNSYNLCMNYVAIFEFILSLYDFEYRLN